MIFDCEGNGLHPTKFHVLSYLDGDEVVSLFTHKDMAEWLVKQDVLIGHNIIRWDIPNLERVLNIKIKAQLVDTLAFSWYLYPERHVHGLEEWGEYFGVPKPKIKDWHNLSVEEYQHRCEEDVRINSRLWQMQRAYLSTLYNNDDVISLNITKYLSFKMDCAREQERSGWRLDRRRAVDTLRKLEKDAEERIQRLSAVMPPVQETAKRYPPARPYKKDRTLSATGEKWKKLTEERGLTFDHPDPICVVTGYSDPNPKSSVQIKDWLFSLGWKPRTFKFEREDDGSVRKIPQVKKKDEPELCDSVLELREVEPEIDALAGLSVVNHRINILKAFLEHEENTILQAQIHGLTNTLRFKHSNPLVNLPGVDKMYGEDVRGCLISRDGMELCGSDMSSLEDNTKKHYMWEYDPEYVKEMNRPGFDAHLDLAKHAGKVTQEDIDKYGPKSDKLKPTRSKFKVANYACVYGAQGEKISWELGISKKEGQELVDAYWERNWAVKKVAEDQTVKTVNGQKWLFNPVSKMWYSLRFDKDRFSTLNQGTGVYCFDCWIREFRKVRPQLTAQFHDEVILEIKKGNRDKCEKLLKDAIKRVNDLLKLNVTLDVDVQFGNNYAEIH